MMDRIGVLGPGCGLSAGTRNLKPAAAAAAAGWPGGNAPMAPRLKHQRHGDCQAVVIYRLPPP
jgi:hypothetical protein